MLSSRRQFPPPIRFTAAKPLPPSHRAQRSPTAAPPFRGLVESLRPFLATASPRAPSPETEGERDPAGVVLSPQISWLPQRLLRPYLPYILKLMPPKHVGKKVLIQLRMFAQHSDSLA